ncbi:hypothetical protein DEO72_LG9g2940 [Vigna unguiculata]|uniref:Uncharacterized protein n=1 Tax=Vigna unguiculata TaxID=3917 RepID=A0A4D6N3Q6_VIGUN|nr:hypothetical protein DEO72_LG9g2940 [Vigna unguiculata]
MQNNHGSFAILPANKHCDTASKDVEPGSVLAGESTASSSEGFEGYANVFGFAEAVDTASATSSVIYGNCYVKD